MVLGLAVGWAAERLGGLGGATVAGALLGMLVANFVPLDTGCGDGR